jgi:23S rRNA (pseudouridine1915-N3)-methyltransferase
VLLTANTAHEKWCDLATELYLEKINHFVKFELLKIRSPKAARNQSGKKKEDESKLFLEAISSDDYVVLFDERGESFDSRQFSKKMEKIQNSGKKRTVFILGGAFGVTEEIKKRAQLQVSFSKMVFNHLVAQTVALEQIYRGFSILNNIPYHND